MGLEAVIVRSAVAVGGCFWRDDIGADGCRREWWFVLPRLN